MKLKPHLLGLLAINEDEYAQLVYETGVTWLNNHFGATMLDSLNMMMQSSLFWNWWKRQWQLRDDELIHQYSLLEIDLHDHDVQARQILQELYIEKHQTSMQVYPAASIIKTIRKQYNLIQK